MNSLLENELIAGITLAVYLQVFLLGLFTVATSKLKIRALLLGFFCCAVSGVSLFSVFVSKLEDYFLVDLFLAGYKSLFTAPLLYLYIILLVDKVNTKKKLWYHLFTPTLLCTLYLILKYAFNDIYTKNVNGIRLLFMVINILMYFIYFVLMFFNRKKIEIILPFVRKKYLAFYFSLLSLLLSPVLIITLGLFTSFFYENYNDLSTYLYTPISFIACFLIIIFTVSENNTLKNFFVAKSPFLDKDLVGNKSEIEDLIQEKLIQEKRFKDVNLKLNDISQEFNITTNAISEFLRFYHKKSFNEFINDLRIEEFKTVSTSADVSKLSISGIAFECGFKSKATFYRLFKEKEGISPGEYLKKM